VEKTTQTKAAVIPEVVAESAVPTGQVATEPMQALAQIDVQDQTEHGLKMFAERAKTAREMMKIALTLTFPGQWVVMEGGEGGPSVYATAGAADRILRQGFGMRFGEKKVKIEKDSKGDTICIVQAPLLKHNGELYEVVEGRRKMGGYVKNENDLVKSACANMAHRAITEILGLRFLTPDDFKDLGLDLSKLQRRVEFNSHGADESGGAPGGVALVTWGNKKGTPVTEVDDGDLDYYEKKARETIADPAKSKFKAKETRWLEAVLAEKERRKAPKPAAAPSAPAPAAVNPLWKRICSLIKTADPTISDDNLKAFVKTATGKPGAKDLVEEDVDKVAQALRQYQPAAREPGEDRE
jgi:hypothetical protein